MREAGSHTVELPAVTASGSQRLSVDVWMWTLCGSRQRKTAFVLVCTGVVLGITQIAIAVVHSFAVKGAAGGIVLAASAVLGALLATSKEPSLAHLPATAAIAGYLIAGVLSDYHALSLHSRSASYLPVLVFASHSLELNARVCRMVAFAVVLWVCTALLEEMLLFGLTDQVGLAEASDLVDLEATSTLRTGNAVLSALNVLSVVLYAVVLGTMDCPKETVTSIEVELPPHIPAAVSEGIRKQHPLWGEAGRRELLKEGSSVFAGVRSASRENVMLGGHGRGSCTVTSSSIKVIDLILKMLADLDLDGAAAELYDATESPGMIRHSSKRMSTLSCDIKAELPPDIHVSLELILTNLRRYRCFLPETLFDAQTDFPSAVSSSLSQLSAPPKKVAVAAPGSTGVCALMFTDIVSSSLLWKTVPEAMRVALRLHDKLLRTTTEKHSGYEVKTIGDSFMIAFERLVDSIQCGLSMQEDLTKLAWPCDLREVPCSRYEEATWSGLRIRIGVHYGAIDSEQNQITGRHDYFGDTVNRAARIVSVSMEGSVGVTETTLAAAWPSLKEKVSVLPAGQTALKGMDETVALQLLVLNTMPNRIAAIRTALERGVTTNLHLHEEKPPEAEGHNTEMLCFSPVEGGDFAPAIMVASNESLRQVDLASVVRIQTRVPYHEVDPTSSEASMGSPQTAYSMNSRYDFDNPPPGVVHQAKTPDEISQVLNAALDFIMRGVERSGGSIECVLSRSVVVSFNVAKRCQSHVESSLRLAGLVHSSTAPVQYPFTSSIVTGPALSGYLFAGSKRFVTVSGASVEVAELLNATTFAFGVACLYTNLSGKATDRLLAPYIRPITVWNAVPADIWAGDLHVYQVNTDTLSSGEDKFLVYARSESNTWAWSKDYRSIFASNDANALEEKAGNDPVLKRVASVMRNRGRVHSGVMAFDPVPT